MKQLFCSLILWNSFFCSFGQNQRQIDTWFFGIPLNEGPKIIQEQLNTDPRIVPIKKQEIIGGTIFPGIGYHFGGRVPNPVKLNLVSADSLKIEQTYGVINESETHEYIGKTKEIRIEYFFSDTMLLRKVYELAIKDLTNGIKNRDVHKGQINLMGKQGEGYYFYFKNRKKFRRGGVHIEKLSENRGVLLITYSASST